MSLRWGSTPRRTDRLTVGRNVTLTLTEFRVRSRRLVSSEVGLRWSPACQDVSPEAEERPPLEATWLRTLICVWWWFVRCSHELCKCPINPIINPKPVYSHSIAWQYKIRKTNTISIWHIGMWSVRILVNCKYQWFVNVFDKDNISVRTRALTVIRCTYHSSPCVKSFVVNGVSQLSVPRSTGFGSRPRLRLLCLHIILVRSQWKIEKDPSISFTIGQTFRAPALWGGGVVGGWGGAGRSSVRW
jgi:hypothetical protein